MKKKDVVKSLIFNTAILALVIFASVVMMTGWQFMGYEESLSARKIEALRFFTVDSNILAGIASAVMLVYEVRLMRGRRADIPGWVYVLKHIAAVGVGLTCVVVVCFLAPASRTGYFSLFLNSNLFFHLIIPVLCVISFAFFEKKKLRFPVTFAGLITTFLYGCFYVVNLLIHMDNGAVSYKYDWYGFYSWGMKGAPAVVLIIFSIAYLISWLMWLGHRKDA